MERFIASGMNEQIPSQPRIRTLDPEVAARIAAGEVIERPASVVKELLENALDAGASFVRVDLDGGGLDRVRIQDNGCGIRAADLELAFQRHATSKLSTIEDLEAIATLGFRGEALPSIAAVSTVRVRTRAADEPAGSQIVVTGGVVVDRRAVGLPVGTTVEVSDLFANLPVRRKFLKGRQAEAGSAQQVVSHYAIASPHVAMTLAVDGRTVFSTSGSATVRDVLSCIFDVDLAEQLKDLDGDRHGIRVRGLASRIGYTRGTRGQQAFFVNGRWVRNRVLNVAFEEAYHSMLMIGRHPVCVVMLTIPPAQIDVNVHPAKAEVRFLNEREVFGAIRHTVNSAIMSEFADPRNLKAADASEGGLDAEQLPLLEMPDSAAPAGQTLSPVSRTLPALRVLGQAGALFIIAEGPDGVYMVDQHAAHERVLYDELSGQMEAQSIAVQPLLDPALIDLTPQGMGALLACGDTLLSFGFHVEPFGDTTCLVRAVPAMLQGAPLAETLTALLDDLESGKERSAQQDRLLATMACKAAVKAGQPLSLEEMRYLVQRLETTSHPRTCPHGRPTMILLSTSALERQFSRR